MKTGLSFLAGLAAAGCAIAVVEAVGHTWVIGDGIFAVAVIAYLLGAVAGTLVVSALASAAAARFVPVALVLPVLLNLRAFPHPPWFLPSAVVMLALGWLAGSALSRRLVTRTLQRTAASPTR